MLKKCAGRQHKSQKVSCRIEGFCTDSSVLQHKSLHKKFDFGLPHISTICDWYSWINGNPGFTAKAFHTLQKKVNEEKSAGRHVLCSLLLDEVHIKKSVEWNGKRYVGYVDLGIGTDDDCKLTLMIYKQIT